MEIEGEEDYFEDHEDSLLNAIERGDLEAVKGTLNIQSIINQENEKEEYPLGLAAKLGHIEIVKYLLSQGADQKTVLHEASKGTSIELIQYLVKPVNEGGVGIDVNEKSTGGWTPLHYASSCGAEIATKYLISIGAIVDAKDDNHLTPLSLACRSRFPTICKLLIDSSADINGINKYGEAPLHRAAVVGALPVIKILLDAGANVHAKDNNGLTPFDVAVEMGQKECALCLWENGSQNEVSLGFEYGMLEWQRPCFRNLPPPRYSHSACAVGSKIYICGGYGLHDHFNSKTEKVRGDALNDFWVLDTTQNEVNYIVDIHQSKNDKKLHFDPKKSHFLAKFSEDYTRASFFGETEKHRRCGVIANFPFDKKECSFGYFEVSIISSGQHDCVCIGFCDQKYIMDRQPGWDFCSWGYHGDDGRCYHNKGNGSLWGPTYSSGDIIGCGINFKTGEIFYTKNGVFVGVAYNDGNVDFPVYPLIGLMEGCDVRVNFGQGLQPFKYDFECPIMPWKKVEIPKAIEKLIKSERPNLFTLNEKEILFWGYSLCIYNIETNEFDVRDEKTGYNLQNSDEIVVQKIDDKIYVFNKLSSKFFYFDLNDWQKHDIEISECTPSFRDTPNSKLYSATVGPNLYIWHTGEDEVYTYNTVTNLWSYCKPKGKKPQHEQYSCTQLDHNIVIFGGWDKRKQQNDVHILDTKSMIWFKPSLQGLPFPRPRNNHCAVGIGKRIFMIAGWNGSTFIPDCDILECDSNQIKKVELFSYAFDNAAFSDVLLVSGEMKIECNKIILSSRSVFFRKTFFEDPEIKVLDLSNIPFNILYSVIEFLYKEEVNIGRLGNNRDSISSFLATVHNLCPTVKPHLMERLVLSRILLPSICFEEIQFAWNNPSFVDLTLVVRGTEFGVHKCILTCRSKYFRALLSSGLAESRSENIVLDDDEGDEETDAIVFKYVLEYIYNDRVEITDEINELVVPILISSSKYGVTGCQEIMEDLISHNLDIDNVLSLLLVADRFRAFKLSKSCIQFISHANNMDTVFQSEEYQSCKQEIDQIMGENFYQKKKEEIENELRLQEERKEELGEYEGEAEDEIENIGLGRVLDLENMGEEELGEIRRQLQGGCIQQ